MNDFAEQIKALIIKQCETDAELKALTEKPNKSCEECAKYIIGEAYNTCMKNKQGNVGYWCGVDDTPLINLIVHYYTEDDIKITELPSNVSVTSKAGAIPKPVSPKTEKSAIKPMEKPTPKPVVKPKREEKKTDAVQLDLFGEL